MSTLSIGASLAPGIAQASQLPPVAPPFHQTDSGDDGPFGPLVLPVALPPPDVRDEARDFEAAWWNSARMEILGRVFAAAQNDPRYLRQFADSLERLSLTEHLARLPRTEWLRSAADHHVVDQLRSVLERPLESYFCLGPGHRPLMGSAYRSAREFLEIIYGQAGTDAATLFELGVADGRFFNITDVDALAEHMREMAGQTGDRARLMHAMMLFQNHFASSYQVWEEASPRVGDLCGFVEREFAGSGCLAEMQGYVREARTLFSDIHRQAELVRTDYTSRMTLFQTLRAQLSRGTVQERMDAFATLTSGAHAYARGYFAGHDGSPAHILARLTELERLLGERWNDERTAEDTINALLLPPGRAQPLQTAIQCRNTFLAGLNRALTP